MALSELNANNQHHWLCHRLRLIIVIVHVTSFSKNAILYSVI